MTFKYYTKNDEITASYPKPPKVWKVGVSTDREFYNHETHYIDDSTTPETRVENPNYDDSVAQKRLDRMEKQKHEGMREKLLPTYDELCEIVAQLCDESKGEGKKKGKKLKQIFEDHPRGG